MVLINHAVALSGYDYAGGIVTVTFPTGSTNTDTGSWCLTVNIANNDDVDGDKTFTVTLTTADSDVMLGNSLTTVTIMDDEGASRVALIMH